MKLKILGTDKFFPNNVSKLDALKEFFSEHKRCNIEKFLKSAEDILTEDEMKILKSYVNENRPKKYVY